MKYDEAVEQDLIGKSNVTDGLDVSGIWIKEAVDFF